MSFSYYICSIYQVSYPGSTSNVPLLNGTNFSEWKEKVEFTLGVMDFDLALLKEQPAALTETSSPADILTHNA